MKELIQIQKELKAPKSKYNDFGKYKYRSTEDILEAAKPLCAEYDCLLTLSDDIEMKGDRFYVKAVACVTNADGQSVSVTAYAREELTKKGQDAAQITGSASSYARKYALNGLFCIDDTDNVDSKQQEETPAPQELTYRDKVLFLADERGIKAKDLASMYGLNKSTTEERYAEVLADMEGGNGQC